MKHLNNKLNLNSSEKYLKEAKYCLKTMYNEPIINKQDLLEKTNIYLKYSNAEWASKIDILTTYYPRMTFKFADVVLNMEKHNIIDKNINFDRYLLYENVQFMRFYELMVLSKLKSTYPKIDAVNMLSANNLLAQYKNHLDTKQQISDANYIIKEYNRAIDIKSCRPQHRTKSQIIHSFYDIKTNTFPGILNNTVDLDIYMNQKREYFQQQISRLDWNDVEDKKLIKIFIKFLQTKENNIETLDIMNSSIIESICDKDRRFMSEMIITENYKLPESNKEIITENSIILFNNNYNRNFDSRCKFLNYFSSKETSLTKNIQVSTIVPTFFQEKYYIEPNLLEDTIIEDITLK